MDEIQIICQGCSDNQETSNQIFLGISLTLLLLILATFYFWMLLNRLSMVLAYAKKNHLHREVESEQTLDRIIEARKTLVLIDAESSNPHTETDIKNLIEIMDHDLERVENWLGQS